MQMIIPQTDEFIHGGMYYRCSHVKAGTLVIGCAHKKDSIAFLLSGTIVQVDGNDRYEISAPYVISTQAGSSRQAFALTDVSYATVTSCDTDDITNVEDEMFVEPSINKVVRDDYNSMLIGYGINDDMVQDDMDKFDVIGELEYGLYLDKSGISGLGLFCNDDIYSDDILGFAVANGQKTPLGRYVNHSPFPNCRYEQDSGGDLLLVANNDIIAGIELTVNYRNTLDRIFIGG